MPDRGREFQITGPNDNPMMAYQGATCDQIITKQSTRKWKSDSLFLSHTTFCLKKIRKMKLNEPGGQKLERQCVNHAWLYSDLLQALKTSQANECYTYS